MELLVQETMCILFIAIFGNISSLAVLGRSPAEKSNLRENSMERVRRQGPIVQPDWAINPEINLFQDYNVRVTDEKLEETEAIRDYIQETVDNGTYVVELDEGDFGDEELQAFEETPGVDLSHPEPELEVESTTKNIPATTPEPHPSPEPKPIPVIKPAQESSQPRAPSESQRKSKLPPKSFAAPSGGRFFIWLRKRFNRS